MRIGSQEANAKVSCSKEKNASAESVYKEARDISI